MCSLVLTRHHAEHRLMLRLQFSVLTRRSSRAVVCRWCFQSLSLLLTLTPTPHPVQRSKVIVLQTLITTLPLCPPTDIMLCSSSVVLVGWEGGCDRRGSKVMEMMSVQ